MRKNRVKFCLLLFFCLNSTVFGQSLSTLIGKTANQNSASVVDLVTELNAAYFNAAIGTNVNYLRDAILNRGIAANDYSSLALAINAAQSDSNFVVVNSAVSIATTDTVYRHSGLVITAGGDARITIASGTVLRIEGAFAAPPNRQVFFGGGTVIFGPGTVNTVFTEWWGARADSTGDSGVAFKAAYTAMPNGAKIELLGSNRTLTGSKGYIINTTVRVPSDKNTRLVGNGAIIYSSVADTVFLIQNGSQNALPSYAINPATSQPRHVFEEIRFKRISSATGTGVAIALINSTGQTFNNIDVADYNNAFVFHNISDGWCENNEIFNSRIAGCDTAISYMLSLAGNNSMATNSLRKVTITRFTDSDVINQGAGQAVGIFSDTGTNLYRNVWDQVVIFPKDSVTCVNIDGKAEDLTGTINFEYIGSTETLRMRGFHFGSNSSELRFRLHMNLTGRIYFDEPNIFYSEIPGSFGYSGITTTLDGNQNHGNETVVDSSKFTTLFGIIKNQRLGMVTPADSARIIFANVNNSGRGKLDIRAQRSKPIEIRSYTDNVSSAATSNTLRGSALPLQPVGLLDIGGNRTVNDSTTIDVRNSTHLIVASANTLADTTANGVVDSLFAFKGGIAGHTLTVTFSSSNTQLYNLVGGTGTGRLFLLENQNVRSQSGMKSYFKCESESGGVFWREMWRSAEYGKTTDYTSTVDSIDVAQVNYIRFNRSVLGDIRNFYNGIDGQMITTLDRTGKSTYKHLGKGTTKGISLIGAVSRRDSSGTRHIFVYDGQEDLWREISVSSVTSTGGSGWTDAGTLVNLETTTDNVAVGDANNLGKLTVDGDTDEKQLVVRGHSTQTSNFVEVERSNGVDIFVATDSSLKVSTTANLVINGASGATIPTGFAGGIVFGNGSNPAGTPTNGFLLYGISGEPVVKDGNGITSKLTHAWGALYLSNATTVVSTSGTAGTWVKITGLTDETSPAGQGITTDVNSDSLTVQVAGTYEISVSMSFHGGTASVDNYKIAIAKNGVANTNYQAAATTADNSSIVNVSFTGYYTAVANDDFSLLMTNNTDGDDPTIKQCMVTIKRIN